jgi:Carbohydrate binding domain (family 11)
MKQTTVEALILSALLLCAHAQDAPSVSSPNPSAMPMTIGTAAPTTAISSPITPPLLTTDSPTGTVAASPMPTAGSLTSAPTTSGTAVPTTPLSTPMPSSTTDSPTGAVAASPMPTAGSPPLTDSPTGAVVASPMPTAGSPPPTDLSTGTPTLAPSIFDDESPSVAGTPILTGLAATTVSFKWTSSTDNVAVIRYDIYDGVMIVGNATTNSFKAIDLTPNSAYSFTIVAIDAAENESNASDPLEVVTLVQVDDFDDNNTEAKDNWGFWLTSCDGTLSNGGSSLQYLPGFDGSGARLDYEVDGGEWGLCNLYLDFDAGDSIDLTRFNITGVQFNLQGSEGSTVALQLDTPLADYNWLYYKYNLNPTPAWKTITVTFDQFVAEEEVPYTISEALQSATSLVWEVSQVGRVGWFMLDNVDFRTTASNPEDATSGAMSYSWAVSIIISLFVGAMAL